jgi:prephenate dehydrogenase
METDFGGARVTIVGLGLMGGSLAAALRSTGACREVVGVARRSSTVATATALRFVHRGTTDLQEGVRDADMVVLATPVGDILERVATIGPLLKPGCVLVDVGSTKGAICQAMERLPDHVQPVGGHPMCGKESSGLTMAEPSLYRDRVFVLCPLERTAPEALALAHALVDAVGARALLLDPQRHDRLVATISHLPYALAVTLVAAAEALSQDDPLAWRLAAGGFGDTSRVAAGSVTMMMDILSTNRQAILDTLYEARGQLDRLTRLLEDGDTAALRAHLEAARQRRTEVTR